MLSSRSQTDRFHTAQHNVRLVEGRRDSLIHCEVTEVITTFLVAYFENTLRPALAAKLHFLDIHSALLATIRGYNVSTKYLGPRSIKTCPGLMMAEILRCTPSFSLLAAPGKSTSYFHLELWHGSCQSPWPATHFTHFH